MINKAHRSWRHIAPCDRLWEVARLREGSMNDSGLSHRLGVAPHDALLAAALGRRSVVLVGMMGAGKSSIGRRLAARLGIPFSDADAEIEEAAGMSVADIFEAHGEPSFRSGEARVIARLLAHGPQVLATGGRAFISPHTRAKMHDNGISVWLKAEIDVLSRRLRRLTARPLLKTADPAPPLANLLAARKPLSGESNIWAVTAA